MPHRVITAPGHDRELSLGWLATWWIETFTVNGPGDVLGEPVRFGTEYTTFVVDCYALNGAKPSVGRRLYDSAFFSRPKGCNKSGLAAAIALFEAFGPARFAGIAKGAETYEFLGRVYTYQKGEPMGRAVKSPFIRIMATEENQTGNVYDTIYYNLSNEDCPLYQLRAYGLLVGLTKIVLPMGGEIRPSTAGSASKDGGIETFVVFDESHLYNTPQLRGMFRTVSKNLRKRKKTAETWYLETTTMYAPGEESIAEETYHLADAIEAKKAKRSRLLFDHRWADVVYLGTIPATESTPAETQEEAEDRLRNAFFEAYGEAIAWNDVEALIDGIYDTHQSESETRRYFFNALVASSNAWVQVAELAAVGVEAHTKRMRLDDPNWLFEPLDRGDQITLGFDGARNDDATALVACRISDRFVFPIGIWETPDGPEAKNYQIDRLAVDAAVHKAFTDYDVVGFYADPPLWQDYVDAWAKEFGDQLKVKASTRHEVEWWTKADIPMAAALERLHTAIVTKTMILADDVVLVRHILNARRWKRRGGEVIGKDVKGSPRKMDAAIAATLAFEAAADYVQKGHKAESQWYPFHVR